jgi:DNA-binding CsgD family transcriptional regulator
VLLHQCLRVYRGLDHQANIAAVLTALGKDARGRGDFAQARHYLEESLTILTGLGHAAETARCLAWLGAVARGEGELALARSYLARSLALGREITGGAAGGRSPDGEEVAAFRCFDNDVWCMWILGAAACDEGDEAAARAYLREELTLNPHWDPMSLASALLEVARVAILAEQPERAARLFASAEGLRASSRYPWPAVDQPDRAAVQSALCSSLAEQALQHASREGAAMTLSQALSYALETLGPPSDAVVVLPLSPTDGIARQRGPIPPPRRRLTPRQREIAALVAHGFSNRQIAEQLVITERTAENHVEHILAKLGFHSRVQVAVWVGRQGAAADGGKGDSRYTLIAGTPTG